MAKKLIGHSVCPECSFPDAEIGEDKNGNPYRHCPDCNAQYFTRGDPARVANLRKLMRPVKADPAPAPKKNPDPAPVKKRGVLDEFFGAKK
jgi:hypothetical protein